MKKLKTIYWVITIPILGLLGLGAVYDAISAPEALEHITRIGYPTYIVPFLGVAKILGIVAILIPGYPRVKEWAYAGLIFDLVGATYSHFAFGDNKPADWIPMVVFIGLLAASYVLYHKIKDRSV
jgi:hypothetical protein